MISRQHGMVGRSTICPNQAPPQTKIPVTFETDCASVFRGSNVLSMGTASNGPKEEVFPVTDTVVDKSAANSLWIWNNKKNWFWRLRTDRVKLIGLESTLSKYNSFLEMLWSASPYLPDEFTIYTDSVVHIKMFKTALARISLQDPCYSVSLAGEVEAAIYKRFRGKNGIFNASRKHGDAHKRFIHQGF